MSVLQRCPLRESRLYPCFTQKWSNCTCLIELQWQQLFSLMDDCDTKNFTPFVMFVFNDYTIPRLIQTLFLNFDGILTRYLLPSGVSASWRLLPRLPKILNNIDRYFSRDKFFLKWRNYTVALLAKWSTTISLALVRVETNWSCSLTTQPQRTYVKLYYFSPPPFCFHCQKGGGGAGGHHPKIMLLHDTKNGCVAD